MRLFEIEGSVLYHVTKTDNVPRIQKKGLLRLQTSNWLQAGNKERYGQGEIFAFESLKDAIRWAGRWDWELNKKMGTGKVSIIKFKRDGKWTVDKSDPISQAGAEGAWLKSEMPVTPDKIISITPVTADTIRSATL